MLRSLAVTVAASAVYGFAIGSVHSPCFAVRNLLKFPLLIVVTAALCAPAYYLTARLLDARSHFARSAPHSSEAPPLRGPGTGPQGTGPLRARSGFMQIQRTTLAIFRDTSVLLAALAPVSYFLAHTIARPDQSGLGEYPMFLGLNVLFIALCGALALVRQTSRSLSALGLSRRRGVLTVACWLGLTLLVGGQWAWYLRPFFGVSRAETPFCLGAAPDYQGARNFYEAVYHLVDPPPLPRGFIHSPSTAAPPRSNLTAKARSASRTGGPCKSRDHTAWWATNASNRMRIEGPCGMVGHKCIQSDANRGTMRHGGPKCTHPAATATAHSWPRARRARLWTLIPT